MSTRLEGRVVLITGVGSAVGRAMAVAFAAAGAQVVAGDRHRDVAEKLVSELGTGLAIAVDTSHERSVAAMVRQAVDTFGHIDVLCNNAGLIDTTELPADITTAELQRLTELTITGTFLVSHAVADRMADQGIGTIIITAPGDDHRDAALRVLTTAARINVASLAKNLAHQYADKGIRAEVIVPNQNSTSSADPEQLTGLALALASEGRSPHKAAPDLS